MKSSIKKYLGEGLLIVFSVLFALFINKWFDDYQTYKRKETAQESIEKELERNLAVMETWRESHQKIKAQIASVLSGKADSVITQLQQHGFFHMGALTDEESLFNKSPSNTAWESVKTSGLISEFDYETVMMLTEVYDLQEGMLNKTLMNVLNLYFDRASHDMENVEETLIQFQLRFWELTGQEVRLVERYKEALATLQN